MGSVVAWPVVRVNLVGSDLEKIDEVWGGRVASSFPIDHLAFKDFNWALLLLECKAEVINAREPIL